MISMETFVCLKASLWEISSTLPLGGADAVAAGEGSLQGESLFWCPWPAARPSRHRLITRSVMATLARNRRGRSHSALFNFLSAELPSAGFDSSSFRQLGGFVGGLPREVGVITAKVPASRRLAVDRPTQLEMADDPAGRQREEFTN